MIRVISISILLGFVGSTAWTQDDLSDQLSAQATATTEAGAPSLQGSVTSPDTSPNTNMDMPNLAGQGFTRWTWLSSTCDDCEIILSPITADLKSALVQEFIQALATNKADLQRLYGIHGAEYTWLAQMAVGILGRESKFFQSKRYRLKEEFPWAVYLAKVARSYLTGAKVDPNSRGPTQIKTIPAKIVSQYGFRPDDLKVPAHAAIATMGFLIEALGEMKKRIAANQLTFVTPANYVDYLPYVYFGATKTLVSGRARPETNLYVQEMKKYMSWVEVYERPPPCTTLCSPAVVMP